MIEFEISSTTVSYLQVATIIGRLSSLQNLCTRLIFVPFEPEEKADV
jgi:hypothetical protein